MQPGLSSYTYTWAVGVPGYPPEKPLTIYDLISRTRQAGFSVLQIADNLPVVELDNYTLSDIRNYASESGVKIEIGGRGLSPDHTMRCLSAAEKTGSSILRMVIDSAGYEPDIITVISIIKELIPEFKSRNIRLAIENHDRFKAREFEKIILAAGSDWVGICLDSVNSMGAGEGFESVAGILMPYTINLHIKDFSISRVTSKMGFIIEGRPAGKGSLNIRELIKEISRPGKCESAILELWTPPENEISATIAKEKRWADESISFLKTVFKNE